jgi:hypothetical protein
MQDAAAVVAARSLPTQPISEAEFHGLHLAWAEEQADMGTHVAAIGSTSLGSAYMRLCTVPCRRLIAFGRVLASPPC